MDEQIIIALTAIEFFSNKASSLMKEITASVLQDVENTLNLLN